MNSRKNLLAAVGGLFALTLAYLCLRYPPDGLERGEFRQFLGRFHPTVVHLPIALVLLVALLECAGLFPTYKQLRAAAGLVLGLATIGAVVAVSLGWLLARSGGYEGQLVIRHMWGGVALACTLLICSILRGWNSKGYGLALVVAVGLTFWTSHQGGKLTHGEHFLTERMPSPLRSLLRISPTKKPTKETAIANAAVLLPATSGVPVAFFATRVQPIFEDKCTLCHGPEKKKGKLRLDSFENVMKGGKDGLVITPGDPKRSELIRRVNLPREDEHAMPAEGKPALSAAEIKVLEYWIANGAPETIAAESAAHAPVVPPPAPPPPPLAADYRPRIAVIEKLQNDLGVRLVPRSQNPRDGLILRTVTAPDRCTDATLEALRPVADLIVDAELARTKISDKAAAILQGFPNLRSVDFSQTAISPQGAAPLARLSKLESLNLTATAVDDEGVRPLMHKPGLHHLYLFGTHCSEQGDVMQARRRP